MQRHDTTDLTPDEISAALERDRNELTANIEGLRDRLSLEAVVGDVLGYAQANMAPYARALDGAVRSNPMAAVMAGVGLAWLALGRRHGGAATPEPPLAGTKFEALARWEDEGGPAAPLPPDDLDWIAEADALRSRSSDALARLDALARRKLRPAAELARDRAQVLADLAQSTRAAMLRGMDGLESDARKRLLVLREEAYAARLAAVRQGTKLIEERPMAAGAISLAIGAIVAAALPRTRTEDRLFGQERDRLLTRAQEALRQERAHLARTASRLAGTVASDVKASARELASEST
jgi:hypothetical protein